MYFDTQKVSEARGSDAYKRIKQKGNKWPHTHGTLNKKSAWLEGGTEWQQKCNEGRRLAGARSRREV